MSNEANKTNAKTPKADAWIVCKNGNFNEAFANEGKAIAGLRRLSGADKAEVVEKKDGSRMLKDVRHFRAKPIQIS